MYPTTVNYAGQEVITMMYFFKVKSSPQQDHFNVFFIRIALVPKTEQCVSHVDNTSGV